ncbi:MAG: SRPBCC family protein [Acidobacteriota bacterium]
MPRGSVREVIGATAETVFDLVHDYDRRLEWDSLLQDAYIEPPFTRAGKGVITVCRGHNRFGGIAIRTVYLSFERGVVAAVKMINRPVFFDSFAASIRHVNIDERTSSIQYQYSFLARPAFLRPVLHPVMNYLLNWETAKRLRALRERFSTEP